MFCVTPSASEQPRDKDGRWGEKPHADPGQTVLANPIVDGMDWEPADSYPYPQANDLDKVAIVADLVRRGADTSDAIALALNLSPREGRYYADAAAWMGFLERGGAGEGAEVYRVSRGAGEQFVELTNSERAMVIGMIVDQIEDATSPRDEVVQRLERDGLSPVTARRRADTMRSWRTQVDSLSLTWKIGDTEERFADRFDASFALAREQRAEARAKKAAGTVMRGKVCARCFVEMPLTGLCPNCD